MQLASCGAGWGVFFFFPLSPLSAPHDWSPGFPGSSSRCTMEQRMKTRETHSADVGHLRGMLRDFTDALGQQMFFWGRDVIHSDGNLLCAYGLERRKSEGLDGTSCYRMLCEDGLVELHGACAGLYAADRPGFLYIRNRKRCFLYHATEPPAPGFYAEDFLEREPLVQLQTESRRFLKWWLAYEAWIDEVTSPGYRDKCHRAFRSLPLSRSWLAPGLAREWLERYAASHPDLSRARLCKESSSRSE